jgi:hypothetical protein
MAIQTLTGGDFVIGSAIDNTQTDQYTLYGVGNTVWEPLGNLTVNSGATKADITKYGNDTSTTIEVGGTKVKDSISIGGGGNSLSDFGDLTKATVTYTVTDNPAGSGGNIVGDGGTTEFTNSGGKTTISLGGASNQVYLNGNATNNVTLTGGGGSTVVVGSGDDDLFGFKSTIALAGNNDTVTGGDEDFTVTDASGTTGPNSVSLGDGNNSVTLSGTDNTVSVWGGNNTINAGGSGADVAILGIDGASDTEFVPDSDDGPVPASPTDDVTIGGTGDSVTATYENVVIAGLAVTSDATITLGNGNNNISLGGTGGNTVTVGNGANTINATGNGSTYNLGNGPNGVTLSGNGNNIVVTDPTGSGLDTIQLGAGTGDSVNLDHAGGSVTDTGSGTTTVTQTGPHAVTVSLNDGTGLISLGDGNDSVTANGAGTTITAGNGNDTVTATGGTKANPDSVTLGNGTDNLTIGNWTTATLGNGTDTVGAGNNDTLSLENGNDTVSAGNNDTLTLGNGNNSINAGNDDGITLGYGSNTVTAGKGGSVTLNALASSNNTVTVGANETVSQTNGILNLTGTGAKDIFNLNGLAAGSVTNVLANGDTINFMDNSTDAINLNPSASGDTISVFGSSGQYSGMLTISDFGAGQTLDLEGLFGGKNGQSINSFSEVVANLSAGPLSDNLLLAGGGSIDLKTPVTLNSSEFKYS